MRRAAASPRWPSEVTAVFVANDQMALGVLRALTEEGVRVPEQVSIVGFDDIPEAEFFSPPLTTVSQDFGAVGRGSIEVLLRQIEDGPGPLARASDRASPARRQGQHRSPAVTLVPYDRSRRDTAARAATDERCRFVQEHLCGSGPVAWPGIAHSGFGSPVSQVNAGFTMVVIRAEGGTGQGGNDFDQGEHVMRLSARNKIPARVTAITPGEATATWSWTRTGCGWWPRSPWRPRGSWACPRAAR